MSLRVLDSRYVYGALHTVSFEAPSFFHARRLLRSLGLEACPLYELVEQ